MQRLERLTPPQITLDARFAFASAVVVEELTHVFGEDWHNHGVIMTGVVVGGPSTHGAARPDRVNILPDDDYAGVTQNCGPLYIGEKPFVHPDTKKLTRYIIRQAHQYSDE